MSTTDNKAWQAAMSAYQAWSDCESGTSLNAQVKAWAKHYQVSVQLVWLELDPYLD